MWTDEEINILKEMAANGYMDREIAKKLGRTKSSVSSKRYNKGIEQIKLDENLFSEWNNKNSWLLGFITADGNTGNKTRPNEIILYNTDLKLIKAAKKAIKSKKKIYNTKSKNKLGNKPVYRLQFSSSKIVKFLKSINAYGTKEERNPFPIIPDKYKWPFIKGLFDGDGNFYKGSFSIAGRHELIRYVYYWMCHQIKRYPNKIYTSSTTDITKYFQFSVTDSKKIFELMDKNSQGTYDSEKYNSWKNYFREVV